jgi:hypothetical protein
MQILSIYSVLDPTEISSDYVRYNLAKYEMFSQCLHEFSNEKMYMNQSQNIEFSLNYV